MCDELSSYRGPGHDVPAAAAHLTASGTFLDTSWTFPITKIDVLSCPTLINKTAISFDHALSGTIVTKSRQNGRRNRNDEQKISMKT
ncbi:hypothetical protein RRG08_057919 [Elysia crispata]|uniref:Uncharacterized protein n=1 Tax=Elysia crispata TaxID=231223 RepID=A0AAE1DR93_9GAST|nr:hypothetical protein RRG08_057919 [Elysia crispata]